MSRRQITAEERVQLRQQLAADYRGGSAIRALADRYGLSYGIIHRLLREAGVTLRRRGSSPLLSDQERLRVVPLLITAYGEGQTIKAVAARYGLSYGPTRRLLAEAGVTMRPPGTRSPGAAPQTRRRLTPQDRTRLRPLLAADYRAGHIVQTVADRHGLTHALTTQLLREAGVTLRRRGPRGRA